MRQQESIRFACFLFCLVFLLSGCSLPGSDSSQQPGVEQPVDELASEGEATPTQPPLLTKVHLQASYRLPDRLGEIEATHDEMRYLLWLPEAYWEEQGKKWPLIIYLHGAGDDDYDSASVISGGLPAVLFLDEQPADFPFVVISPQAFPGGTWWSDETLPALDGLIGEVLETYALDPDRVYLTGVSMGGYGSWYMATAYPERFAAMVSVSGSGYRTQAVPGDEILCRMADLAVWGVHGAQDRISAPEASKFFVAALKSACKGEVEFTMYEDLNHMTTPERIYRDPGLYAWLLAHSRTE